MPELIPLPIAALSCFLTALVISLCATPVAGRAAQRFGIVDKPDGQLKRHRQAVPYLGGLAVYGSFILTMALVFDFDQRVLGLLLAGTLLVLLGLIDDLGVLGVWPKFLGQGFATLVLIKSDIAIHIAVLPDWANLVLTILWIVGMTNALNLIDIMDGLASGTALIAASFLLVVAVMNGQGSIVLMTATLMGSLLGFLRFNVHPARIFLGDTGSLFIGMMLGSLAMIGKYDRFNAIGYLSPILILAVPIFDTAYVVLLRISRGLNPLRGSPDHLALRLKRAGLPVPAVVGTVWVGGVLLGCLGLFNLYLDRTLSIFLLVGVAATLLMAGMALSIERTGRGGGREVAAIRRAHQNLALWRRR